MYETAKAVRDFETTTGMLMSTSSSTCKASHEEMLAQLLQIYSKPMEFEAIESALRTRTRTATTTTTTATATATAATHTAEASHTADHRGRFNSWCTRALDAAAVGTLPPSLTAGHARRANRFFL